MKGMQIFNVKGETVIFYILEAIGLSQILDSDTNIARDM